MLYLHELFSANNLPNILLFFAGLGGIAVGIWTLRYIRKQTTLLNQYVKATDRIALATLRPKIAIPAIALIPGKIVEVDGVQTLQDDVNWQVQCVTANTGGSSVRVVESNLTILKLGIGTLHGLIPPFPPYSKHLDSFGVFAVNPGERRHISVLLDRNTDTMMLRLLRALQEGGTRTATTKAIFFGFVQYQDEAGIGKRTGFGFEYDTESMGFTRLDHPNYEYAD